MSKPYKQDQGDDIDPFIFNLSVSFSVPLKEMHEKDNITQFQFINSVRSEEDTKQNKKKFICFVLYLTVSINFFMNCELLGLNWGEFLGDIWRLLRSPSFILNFRQIFSQQLVNFLPRILYRISTPNPHFYHHVCVLQNFDEEVG